METKEEIARETKFLQARNDYGLNARLGYPRIMDETDRQICDAFEAGKNWADENPKPNLVDIDKAVEWLKSLDFKIYNEQKQGLYIWYTIFNKDKFIESFKKEMEGE